MVGSDEVKLAYFNNGLIETLSPMIQRKEIDSKVRFEALTILNSFLFDCSEARSTLQEHFHNQLVEILKFAIKDLDNFVQTQSGPPKHQSCFRFLRNLLK